MRTSEIQALVHRLGERLAPSTIEVVYGRVVAVFRAAVRDRVITTSPCTGIRLPSKPPASMLEVLSTEQVYALVDAIAPRYAALVLTAASTGLRPGELFGLRTGRVDFLRRTVRVDQQGRSTRSTPPGARPSARRPRRGGPRRTTCASSRG